MNFYKVLFTLLFLNYAFLSHCFSNTNDYKQYLYFNSQQENILVSNVGFASIADHIVGPHFSVSRVDIKPGDIFYVPLLQHKFFISSIAPKLKDPYILLTPKGTADQPYTNLWKLLYDDKCAAWFCKNLIITNFPKLFPIPVGQTLKNPRMKKAFHLYPYFLDLRKKNIPKDIFATLRLGIKDPNKFKHRRLPIDILKTKDFISYFSQDVPFTDYWDLIARSVFVVAPRGVGIDTLRFWEALTLGAIPIVISSPLNSLYKDLPCVIVNDWGDLSKEFLEEKYAEIQNKLQRGEYNLEKLWLPYWRNKIYTVKQEIINGTWDKSSIQAVGDIVKCCV